MSDANVVPLNEEIIPQWLYQDEAVSRFRLIVATNYRFRGGWLSMSSSSENNFLTTRYQLNREDIGSISASSIQELDRLITEREGEILRDNNPTRIMNSLRSGAFYPNILISRSTAYHPEFDSEFPFVEYVSNLFLNTTCIPTDGIEPLKKLKTIKQKITKESKNKVCPITYEKIKRGETYLTCDTCKYNFSEKAIRKHLENKNTCPMCRSDFELKNKYINENPPNYTRTKLTRKIIKFMPVLNRVLKEDFTIKTNNIYAVLGNLKAKLKRYHKRFTYGK